MYCLMDLKTFQLEVVKYFTYSMYKFKYRRNIYFVYKERRIYTYALKIVHDKNGFINHTGDIRNSKTAIETANKQIRQ